MECRVIFHIKAFQKLMLYARNCEFEISGMSKVSRIDNVFYVEDVFLLKQKGNFASTDFPIGRFLDDVLKRGEEPADYKCWWHSHANMATMWSQRDETTIEDMDIEKPVDNWWLSIVVNKAGDVLCRLDVFQPIRHTLDKLKWELDIYGAEMTKIIKAEIKQKVKEVKFKHKDTALAKMDDPNYKWSVRAGDWVRIKGRGRKKNHTTESFHYHKNGRRRDDGSFPNGSSNSPVS